MLEVRTKKEGLTMEELKAQSGVVLPKRLEIRRRRRGGFFFGGICIGFCGGGGFFGGGGG